jgi:hypothetical protein
MGAMKQNRNKSKHRSTGKEDSMKYGQLEDAAVSVAKRFPTRLALIAIALVGAVFFTGCATEPKQATAGKFYHVGLVWLKEPGNAEHRQKIIAAAHSFAREIPEVEFLSVGQTLPKTSQWADASFDICLVMRLEDRAALDRYGRHPVHQKAAQEVFLPLSQKILFYDFTSE